MRREKGTAVALAADPAYGTGHSAPLDLGFYLVHFFGRYRKATYYTPGCGWHDYEPAYQFGYSSYHRVDSVGFDGMENELRVSWDAYRRRSRLEWDQARPALLDGWGFIDRARPRS